MHTPDGETDDEAGQSFWAPGHAPEALEDSEWAEFSPTEQLKPVLDHIRAQGERSMSGLNVRVWGSEGAPAVLVHGSLTTGEEEWEAQRPLAEEGFRLVVPDRRGYGDGAEVEGEDFLGDAQDVAELLGDGAHLVGHSYGGIGALLAAARRPDAVRSLAVAEPPAFALRREDPAVAELLAELERLWSLKELDDRAFLEEFLRTVGSSPDEAPEEMLEVLAGRVALLRKGRQVAEAEIPLDRLAAARFPKLVISGGHHPAFDAVCDELTSALGAERAEVKGAGHEMQMVAEPFNEALLGLWRSA